jgi:pimeloyl-ACP methyl ester carboxylesterase
MLGRRALLAGLVAAPALALPEPATPGVRRRYLDASTGQIHLREAGRARRGRAPLLLLHQSPLSGRMFDRLLPLLAADRLVLAVDTPGYGESDRPAERLSLAGYGDAILDAVTRAYGRPVDLFGYHTGAAIAAELAARRAGDVRRLVLCSMPYFDSGRRAELLKSFDAKTPLADDGSHLPPLWTSTFRVKPAGQSADDVARIVAEKQRVGRTGEWALRSAMEADLAPVLAAIRAPTLVMAPHDGLQAASKAAAERIPGARLLDLPDIAYGLFDAAPAAIAGPVDAFLAAR